MRSRTATSRSASTSSSAYPAPYGLIRYGVAPDHPRIKGIVNALHKVLDRGDIRFFGNVDYGTDLTLDDFRAFYDAVIFSTGAIKDADLDIPGIDLEGSYGGADFVSWYDGHPDVPRDWPLEAKEIAVIGNGNVALDVARMLAKHADDLLVTEIPDNVYAGAQGLAGHRRARVRPPRPGPGEVHARWSCASSATPRTWTSSCTPRTSSSTRPRTRPSAATTRSKTMVNTLTNWLVEEHAEAERTAVPPAAPALPAQPRRDLRNTDDAATPARSPASSSSAPQLDGTGNVKGTGEFLDYPVQAVYRAIGYHGSPLAELEYDARRGVVPNEGGRVLDADGQPRARASTPRAGSSAARSGLIGHTKGDALETIGFLLEDRLNLPPAQNPDPQAIIDLLEERGIEYTTWEGWIKLDAHELALGAEWSAAEAANGIVAGAHQGGAARGHDGDFPRVAGAVPGVSGGWPAGPLDWAGRGCLRHAIEPVQWEFNEEPGPSGSTVTANRRGHRTAAPAICQCGP